MRYFTKAHFHGQLNTTDFAVQYLDESFNNSKYGFHPISGAAHS